MFKLLDKCGIVALINNKSIFLESRKSLLIQAVLPDSFPLARPIKIFKTDEDESWKRPFRKSLSLELNM